MGGNLCAVYDFELMPYALGDVLTWNVQTAIRCEEAGRERVDAYICLDERFPSSLYQRDLVTAENCGLFFSELFGAFGTHPRLGNLLVYRRRDEMLEKLRAVAAGDATDSEVLADYEQALRERDDDDALIRYFTKHGHSHERINAFAARHGWIPLLRPSLGCEPDVAGLIAARLASRRIVPIHVRLRRLDAGYGGGHTYARDSDFLEWFEFLREAQTKHPDVQFVLLGRLQEKPLELLKLPNVMSLRTLGLGLGHELTLMLHSDLFLGTSSGFAAMANFSGIPYFITRMTEASCKAYGIEPGSERLPFATERQILIYEPETTELLMRLLERGIQDATPRNRGSGPWLDPEIDVRSWEWERSTWLHRGATTFRFSMNEVYVRKETAFVLWPKVREALEAWRAGRKDQGWNLLRRIERNFPQVCAGFPEFLRVMGRLAAQRGDTATRCRCSAQLARLAEQKRGGALIKRWVGRFLARGYPLAMRLKHGWKRRHRIPRKLTQALRRLVVGQQ